MAIENKLLELAAIYPEAQLEDYIKFLYQSAFGPGHFVADETAGLARLEAEWAKTAAGGPFLEELSDEYVRVHIGGAKAAGLTVRTLFALFSRAAKAPQADKMDCFLENIHSLPAMAKQGVLPFETQEAQTHIAAYIARGCPAQSHSEAYRQAYNPAYRLVGREAALFMPLFCYIDKQLAAGNSVTLNIEGGAATGKTTLAALLAQVYGCAVVHMDDFFLQPDQRTPARLAQVGGNIDYERFSREVTPHLGKGVPFSYRPFNCHTLAYGAPVNVPAHPLTVVEGCYSAHPKLAGPFHCSVFLKLAAQVQSARILARGGSEMHARFMGEWVPKENDYFAWADTQGKSMFTFDTAIL
ncbi:hypothetical protein LJB77_02350 [Ruminococcaceae bacterium OttesenSCG-928-N02]|nr:hypothetical protein [Ruminococcaceae bacterium OttesenSCG-928-N02]